MLWTPRSPLLPIFPLSQGMSEPRIEVNELEGGYQPPPIPPGYQGVPKGLPLTETTESYSGPWTQGGTYGRQIEYTYPATISADPVAVFSIQRQPGPPRPRTLHLFRSDGTLVSGFFNADVYAKVSYGVGGIQNVAFIDWTKGGNFTLVCDSLRVEAVAYAPTSIIAYSPPPGAQILGAMLGHEGAATARPPTFTTQSTKITPGSNAVFVVPDFARWVFPKINNTPPDAGDFMAQVNLFAVGLGRLKLTDSLMQLGTPVTGGATEIDVHHDIAAALDMQVLLQFELGL